MTCVSRHSSSGGFIGRFTLLAISISSFRPLLCANACCTTKSDHLGSASLNFYLWHQTTKIYLSLFPVMTSFITMNRSKKNLQKPNFEPTHGHRPTTNKDSYPTCFSKKVTWIGYSRIETHWQKTSKILMAPINFSCKLESKEEGHLTLEFP